MQREQTREFFPKSVLKLEGAECPPVKESLLEMEEDCRISKWGSRPGRSQPRILSERDQLGKVRDRIDRNWKVRVSTRQTAVQKGMEQVSSVVQACVISVVPPLIVKLLCLCGLHAVSNIQRLPYPQKSQTTESADFCKGNS